MKKTTLLLLLIFGTTIYTFGQRKRDIVREINSYKSNLVSTAAYDTTFSTIWNAIYIVATENYNTIARESESKGYIEAKKEDETNRNHLTIEILGEKAPYRVSFQVKTESRSKDEDGDYSNWKPYRGFGLDNYYTRLQTRLYELIHGPVKLPPELLKKIQDYNAKQTKDRKKIYKGKQY